jgi:hypothetical protein
MKHIIIRRPRPGIPDTGLPPKTPGGGLRCVRRSRL